MRFLIKTAPFALAPSIDLRERMHGCGHVDGDLRLLKHQNDAEASSEGDRHSVDRPERILIGIFFSFLKNMMEYLGMQNLLG